MRAGRTPKGLDLPAGLARDLGGSHKALLNRARNPARVAFGDLSRVFDKSGLKPSGSALGTFGHIHGQSLSPYTLRLPSGNSSYPVAPLMPVPGPGVGTRRRGRRRRTGPS